MAAGGTGQIRDRAWLGGCGGCCSLTHRVRLGGYTGQRRETVMHCDVTNVMPDLAIASVARRAEPRADLQGTCLGARPSRERLSSVCIDRSDPANLPSERRRRLGITIDLGDGDVGVPQDRKSEPPFYVTVHD